MKTVIAATCAAAALALLAFGPGRLQAGLAPQTDEAAPADPRSEGTARANALFGTYRARCGQVAVVAIDVVPPGTGGFADPLGSTAARTGHNLYVALADLRLDARETTTPTDRRNGIRWAGRFTYSAGSVRQVAIGRDGTAGRWSPWQPGGPVYAVALTHRDGGWTDRIDEMPLVTGLGRYARMRRPTCAELPAG